MARRGGALLRALLPRPYTVFLTLLCLLLPACAGASFFTAVQYGVRFAMEKFGSSGGVAADPLPEAEDGSQPVTPSISDGFSTIGGRDFYTFVGAPVPWTVHVVVINSLQHGCRQEGTGCAS